ncbi:hypothetical protein B9Z55_021648 [Caenorhabditis nigoni]|uniref:BED-type domain-containing protein n=1 Tax=Caenorhabditis nigoni TaxID=1611254 RepID=A0A2G5TSY4_9PELO|nr:hypothetical protein B9Z55_021648 [Caenorhabditis nigoni]
MTSPEKSIKLEPEDETDGDYGTNGEGPSEMNLGLNSDLQNLLNPEKKGPAWFPSSKGRSIVWEHITWVTETQRAACNYCPAEFQIKGGTSALLRHLKTNHPAAINFDPENPPPIVRRKKKKTMEDYTIVTEDTKSYMDNLLETFLHDDLAQRPEPSGSPQLDHAHNHPQNRAESEIDEVIRNLQKETAQNGLPEPEQPDKDLRKLLGMDNGPPEQVTVGNPRIGTPEKGAEPSLEGEKSTSPQIPKKRKIEEARPPMEGVPGLNNGKFPMSILSAIRRPPTIAQGQSPFPTVPQPPPPPHIAQLNPGPPIPAFPAKYNAQAVQILDFEAKVLYNQSLHATIAREDSMTTYYRMKARKMELEIKKLERELGEEQEE